MQMSFIKACKEHFGMLPGQGLKEFAEELHALTPKDRDDLKREFGVIGIQIVEK